jgi:hypothetical protein
LQLLSPRAHNGLSLFVLFTLFVLPLFVLRELLFKLQLRLVQLEQRKFLQQFQFFPDTTGLRAWESATARGWTPRQPAAAPNELCEFRTDFFGQQRAIDEQHGASVADELFAEIVVGPKPASELSHPAGRESARPAASLGDAQPGHQLPGGIKGSVHGVQPEFLGAIDPFDEPQRELCDVRLGPADGTGLHAANTLDDVAGTIGIRTIPGIGCHPGPKFR